jgi:hypothetical protein
MTVRGLANRGIMRSCPFWLCLIESRGWLDAIAADFRIASRCSSRYVLPGK